MWRTVRNPELWTKLRSRGCEYLSYDATPERCVELARGLVVGDVVYRGLRNGDLVLINRQPSLHRMSIMAHRVVEIPGLTIRLSQNVTGPYNAECARAAAAALTRRQL